MKNYMGGFEDTCKDKKGKIKQKWEEIGNAEEATKP
jgi:hypothetical protein